MKIEGLKPFSGSVVPGISLTFTHDFEENTVAFSIRGYAHAADGKIIGELQPVVRELPPGGDTTEELWQHTLESISRRTRKPPKTFRRDFFFAIDRIALQHMEDLRHRDAKRDVHVQFSTSVECTVVFAFLGDFGGDEKQNTSWPVMSQYGKGVSNMSNLHILVSDTPLLRTSRLSARFSITISASDWVHDYAPVLGLGQALLVEIPQFDRALIAAESKFAPEAAEFADRLDRAYATLEAMQREMLSGEWQNVIKQSREFWELFTKESKSLHVQQFLKTLLTNSTGLEEEKSGNLINGVSRLYGYASDLLHPVNANGVKEVFVGGKEDAYLAQCTAAGFLNMVAHKFRASLE